MAIMLRLRVFVCDGFIKHLTIELPYGCAGGGLSCLDDIIKSDIGPFTLPLPSTQHVRKFLKTSELNPFYH